MRACSKAALACLLGSICGDVLGNGPANSDVVDELNEIIVTATRLDQAARSVPAAISVVANGK